MAPAVRNVGSDDPPCLMGLVKSSPKPDPRISSTSVTTMATTPPAKASPQEKRKPVFSSATTRVSVMWVPTIGLERAGSGVPGDQPKNDDDRNGHANQPQEAGAHEFP